MPADRPRGGIGAAVAAANQRARRSLLRNHGGGHAPVSNLELFFDLVFVFAVTQISHFIGHHLSWLGLLEGTMLFLAVWWVWIYTTWVTNWLNPDRLPVRLLLLTLMLLSLLLSVVLPDAFGDQTLLFAACYVVTQVGRTACVALFFRSEHSASSRNMVRISLWFCFSAVLWIGGALAGQPWLLPCWVGALAIEYFGPFVLYRVPGLGQSSIRDWDISGSHMAERCSLFIIIALGEGIVVTGSAFADGAIESARVAAFVTAFAGSALMWWLYFDMGAERGARLISGHEQAGRVARNAYTYLHMPIVLGIVITAVGDALLLDHWAEPAGLALVLAQTGGALLFLIGLGLFKRFANTFANFPMSHLMAVLLFALLGLAAWALPISAASFTGIGVVILFVTAVWEWVSYHGGWMERMEARGWRLAAVLRRWFERRRAARLAREG